MATKAKEIFKPLNVKARDGGQVQITGLTFTTRDVSAPIQLSQQKSKVTFTASGTFGTGGTMLIEATENGVDWETVLTLNSGTRSGTTGRWPRAFRARISAGDGTTSLVCLMDGIVV